jgi:hypothetical protein
VDSSCIQGRTINKTSQWVVRGVPGGVFQDESPRRSVSDYERAIGGESSASGAYTEDKRGLIWMGTKVAGQQLSVGHVRQQETLAPLEIGQIQAANPAMSPAHNPLRLSVVRAREIRAERREAWGSHGG